MALEGTGEWKGGRAVMSKTMQAAGPKMGGLGGRFLTATSRENSHFLSSQHPSRIQVLCL